MSEEFKNLIEVYENETAKLDGMLEAFRLEQEVYRKLYNLEEKNSTPN